MDLNTSERLMFGLFKQVQVELRSGHMLMRQHPAQGVDVRTSGKLQNRIRVTEAVKGNMPGDARSFDPFSERIIRHPFGQTLEDAASAPFATQLQGILAQRHEGFGFRLLGTDTEIEPRAFEVRDNIFPFELVNIAEP